MSEVRHMSEGARASRLDRTPRWLDELLGRLEADERIDVAAHGLQAGARSLVEGPLGPVLQGGWLGHSLHPLMTDVPIGCWTCAALLDVVGGRAARPASQRLIGLGTLSAVPTVLTGLAELATLDDADDASRRVATVHAGLNVAAVLSYAESWRRRRRGRAVSGVAWSAVGAVVASASGHLGGHLAFVRGVGHGDRGSQPGTEEGAIGGAAVGGGEPVR